MRIHKMLVRSLVSILGSKKSVFQMEAQQEPALAKPKKQSKPDLFLLRKLHALSIQRGYCYAGNAYLTSEQGSPYLGKHPRTMSRYIATLKGAKLIDILILPKQRRIVLTALGLEAIAVQPVVRPARIAKTPRQNVNHGRQNVAPILSQNNPNHILIDKKQNEDPLPVLPWGQDADFFDWPAPVLNREIPTAPQVTIFHLGTMELPWHGIIDPDDALKRFRAGVKSA